MTTYVHDIGDVERLQATFKDSGGTETDPTTVTFTMRAPDGSETVYVHGTDAELVKSATGVFYVDFAFAQAGRHTLRWLGTGAVAEAAESEHYVKRKGVA